MAPKKHSFLGSLFFGTVALVAAAALAGSYLSLVVDPAKAWFFTLFGLLYPLALVLALLLFVWALFRRSRMRGLLALVLLPSLFFAGRYYRFRGPSDETPPTLKVLSYNVGLFAHGPKDLDRRVLADSVAAFLREQDADLICLQEFYLPADVSIDPWLHARFPGYEAHYYILTGQNAHFGNVTLSRRKVVRQGKTDFEKSTNMALWTDVALDSGTVRIYNCHFESYNISMSGLLEKDGAVEETERKMRRSITERPKQVAQVLESIDSAPVQAVVLGDFNDTPLSYTYFRLLSGRRDSFVRAGRGFGATYRSLWPLLRIDYILYPRALEAVSCRTARVRYSDHYPLIAQYYESGRNLR